MDIASKFCLCPKTIYLNHGSFSPALIPVQAARDAWRDRMDRQPMDFFLRQLEPALANARNSLAEFVGAAPGNLVFADNATYAMNLVAHNVKLEPGDEVLINDHEYGAVLRTWDRACRNSGATLVIAEFPASIESPDQIVDRLLSKISDRTRLLVVSHVTSATALVLPIEDICHKFRQRGIEVCIDGPHAPAQVDVSLDALGCNYYGASCHKWLCGSLGSGFLYVHPDNQLGFEPLVQSWGRLPPAEPDRWDEEFVWIGTRDSSPFLALPTAIDWLTQEFGVETFRQYSGELAGYAEARLSEQLGTKPMASRTQGFYASMAHVPLPKGNWGDLQRRLWKQYQIEVMVIEFKGRWFIRVSCHLYNDRSQIDTLLNALMREGVSA